MVAVPVSIAAVVVLAAPPELFMICGQDLCWYNENNSLPVATWFRVMMTNVILGDLTMAIFDGRRLATHNGQTVKCTCVCMCTYMETHQWHMYRGIRYRTHSMYKCTYVKQYRPDDIRYGTSLIHTTTIVHKCKPTSCNVAMMNLTSLFVLGTQDT